jgi:hypothetical protein
LVASVIVASVALILEIVSGISASMSIDKVFS